ncbi:hypothetical protein ACQKMD_01315 [Viridibacillus sp. NPDC096237]|uniref:hypothetical protein n=1 Tax=Viridibacillus sp. NPDC096237 TaxID=3390721 RepID=UPI003CFF8944
MEMYKNEVINNHGVTVKKDDYWFMHSESEPWLMKIEYIQENGLVKVKHVNWKRKGKGFNWSRMVSDFGWIPNLKPCTEDEIKYFDKRWNS